MASRRHDWNDAAHACAARIAGVRNLDFSAPGRLRRLFHRSNRGATEHVHGTGYAAAIPGLAGRRLARLDAVAAAGHRHAARLYVARSLLAAALALGVAYLLELESPYSAASTVLLVINLNQGAVIGKGMWRFIGTLIGMLAAFALMAAAGRCRCCSSWASVPGWACAWRA